MSDCKCPQPQNGTAYGSPIVVPTTREDAEDIIRKLSGYGDPILDPITLQEVEDLKKQWGIP